MLSSDFWLKDVLFYLNCVSFVHMLHLMDEMRTYKAEDTKKWRETANNCKREESSVNVRLSFVSSYCLRQGFAKCEKFLGNYNTGSYSSVRKYFPATLLHAYPINCIYVGNAALFMSIVLLKPINKNSTVYSTGLVLSKRYCVLFVFSRKV